MLCETSLVCPPFDSLGRLRFPRLELREDGCGFDPAKRYAGFGLLGNQRTGRVNGRRIDGSERT